MKKTIFTMAMTAAVCAAAAAATPADKAAQEKARAAQKASADAWNALHKEAEALVRKDFNGGFANYFHDNIDAARALYESALTNGVMLNAQKIAACRRIAQMHLEATRDGKAALAAMDAAFKLPGLSEEDRKAAEAARKSLRVLMRLEKPEPKAEKKAAETKKDANYFRQSFAALDRQRRDAARAQDALLGDYLPFIAGQDFDAFAKAFAATAKDVDANYPTLNVYRKFRDWTNGWQVKRNPPKAMRDPRFRAFMLEAFEKAPEAKRLSPAEMVAWAGDDVACQAKAAEHGAKVLELAKDPANKIAPAAVDAAKKAVAYKDAGTDPVRRIAAVSAYFAALGKADDKVGQAELLAKEAQALLKAGDEKGARTVWAAREKLVPPRAQAKLACVWWKDAPSDLRGILESDVYKKAPKGFLNRKYGDNLKFLIETDAAILGREMTTDKGEKFRPTELFAFCDDKGVKIMLRAFLDNMADVKAGLAGVPGYETYLATGVDDAYHCIMFDPKEGGKPDDSFVTMYDNATGYRNVTTKKGNLQYSNLYLDDGVATLVSIPWASTFASIPSKSPAWYFEAINWCHGGLSWGGSVSVHQRSTFGELAFSGVDAAALTAIKRRLLFAAKGVFGAALSSRSNGYAEIWKDPELGDQEFWREEAKPFVDRLQAAAAHVKKGMTDAEVDEIYDACGEDMFNVVYRLSQMRTRWLQKKMTE